MGLKKIVHEVEDFFGVTVLVDYEEGIITKNNLDRLTEEWRQGRDDFETFSDWLEIRTLEDE